MSKKEIYSIPNLLGYFRILLIPVFMYLFFSAETTRDYHISAIVVAVSSLTDLFDGMIARKYNMITELGKFVDPLADKLTQGALIICFLSRYPMMWLLLAVFAIKEGFMAIMGLTILRHNGEKLDGAMWYGKICTAILFFTMVTLLFFPNLHVELVNIIILVCTIIMLLTLVLYIPVFVHMYNKEA